MLTGTLPVLEPPQPKTSNNNALTITRQTKDKLANEKGIRRTGEV
jgi:hypothetical protein